MIEVTTVGGERMLIRVDSIAFVGFNRDEITAAVGVNGAAFTFKGADLDRILAALPDKYV